MAGDTKERILETVLELFARNGYPGTSMSNIAERLGITKAALYKHYDDKQTVLKLLDVHITRFIARLKKQRRGEEAQA